MKTAEILQLDILYGIATRPHVSDHSGDSARDRDCGASPLPSLVLAQAFHAMFDAIICSCQRCRCFLLLCTKAGLIHVDNLITAPARVVSTNRVGMCLLRYNQPWFEATGKPHTSTSLAEGKTDQRHQPDTTSYRETRQP